MHRSAHGYQLLTEYQVIARHPGICPMQAACSDIEAQGGQRSVLRRSRVPFLIETIEHGSEQLGLGVKTQKAIQSLRSRFRQSPTTSFSDLCPF